MAGVHSFSHKMKIPARVTNGWSTLNIVFWCTAHRVYYKSQCAFYQHWHDSYHCSSSLQDTITNNHIFSSGPMHSLTWNWFLKIKNWIKWLCVRKYVAIWDSGVRPLLFWLSQSLMENFGRFKHAASLLKLPLTCQYRRREHIWSNHYRAPWTES